MSDSRSCHTVRWSNFGFIIDEISELVHSCHKIATYVAETSETGASRNFVQSKTKWFIFFSFGLNHPLLTAYRINFTELALFGFLLRALLCYDVMSWYILSYCCWGHRVSKDSSQWNIGCRTKIHPWNCCGMYLCSFFY